MPKRKMRNSEGANKQIKRLQGVSTTELGGSGVNRYQGFYNEDYKAELKWPESLKVYEKMMKGDAQVKASIRVCQLPIMAANWFVTDLNSEDPKLREAAELLEKNLFDYKINFNQFLFEALGMLPMGFSIFEIVFGVLDGKVMWEKFAWRKQYSIKRWQMSNGEPGVVQQLTDTFKRVDIPDWKLLLFTNEKEGDNQIGVSLLRSAYMHWYAKTNLYKIDLIAAERNGIGVLKIKMPSSHTPEDVDNAKELGENFYANEQQYVLLPTPEWEAEIMSGGTNLKDLDPSIKHHNREITKNVLAQFLELGTESSGSRALSEDHSSLLYLSLESIAKIISDEISAKGKELLKMNGFDLEYYPRLAFSHIGIQDITGMSSAITSFVNAGLIQVDTELEAYIRKVLQLPEKVEEVDEEGNPIKLDRKNKSKEVDSAKQALIDLLNPKKELPQETKGKKVDPKKEIEDEKKPTKASEGQFSDQTKKPIYEDDRLSAESVFSEINTAIGGVANPATFREYEPSRDLYASESKVAFKKFNAFFNESESKFGDESKEILDTMIEGVLARGEKALSSGKLSDIGQLSLAGVVAYKTLIKNNYKKSYDFGKNEAADELDILAPKTPSKRVTQMNLTADALVDRQMADMQLVAKTTLLDGVARNLSVKETMFNTKIALNKKADTLNRANVGISVIGQVTQARQDVFQDNIEKIELFQYSAILDSGTTKWCSSLDGRVVQSDSPEFEIYRPGQHYNCRSLWVAIGKDEKYKPKAEPISGALPKQDGGPNNFKDLDGIKSYTPKVNEPPPIL